MLKKIAIDDKIVLKEIELSDSQDIFDTIDSQRDYLGKWLPFVKSTKTVEFTKNFIRSITDVPDKDRELTFVIYYEKKFAGLIGFKDTDRMNHKTELGYWLSKSFQGKGIMTKSVEKLCRLAFFHQNINRVQIKVAAGNIPSRKIPERLNFKMEGIERDGELLSKAKYTDLQVFSLLRREYNE